MGPSPRLHKIKKYEAMKTAVNTDTMNTTTPNRLIQKWSPNPRYSSGVGFFVFSLISRNLKLFPRFRRNCALCTASWKTLPTCPWMPKHEEDMGRPLQIQQSRLKSNKKRNRPYTSIIVRMRDKTQNPNKDLEISSKHCTRNFSYSNMIDNLDNLKAFHYSKQDFLEFSTLKCKKDPLKRQYNLNFETSLIA